MRKLVTFSTFLLGCITAHADDTLINPQYLSSVVNDVKQTADLPSGTAIAVVKGDKIIYEGYFGLQNIAENIPVGSDTQFYIASVTKPFTALNALLDAEEQAISMDISMKDMFPDFSVEKRQDATLGHLLTHQASISNRPLALASAYSGVHDRLSLQALVNVASEASSEPIGTFKYTNVGYNIYGVYAETIFKQSWQNRLRDNIFNPLGMKLTTASRSALNAAETLAKPYSLLSDERKEALYLEKSDATLHNAGGMFSTATDLGRFLIVQLNMGVIDGEQVFPSAIIAHSQSQQVSTHSKYQDFKRDGYAWGWYTGQYKSYDMRHHFGGFAGNHAHVSFIPSQKIGIVILNNEDFLSSRLTSVIADYLYGALLAEADLEVKIDKRIDSLKSRLSGLDAMLAKENQTQDARKWNLSRPESDYVGVYSHSLLGDIRVAINPKQRFDLSWGAMKSRSWGMNDVDHIRVEMEPNSGQVITFKVTDQVKSLTYAGIEFIKTSSDIAGT